MGIGLTAEVPGFSSRAQTLQQPVACGSTNHTHVASTLKERSPASKRLAGSDSYGWVGGPGLRGVCLQRSRHAVRYRRAVAGGIGSTISFRSKRLMSSISLAYARVIDSNPAAGMMSGVS